MNDLQVNDNWTTSHIVSLLESIKADSQLLHADSQLLHADSQLLLADNQILKQKLGDVVDRLVVVEGKLDNVLSNTVEIKGMVLSMFDGISPKTKSQIERAAEFVLEHKKEVVEYKIPKGEWDDRFKLRDVAEQYSHDVKHGDVVKLGTWVKRVFSQIVGQKVGAYSPQAVPLVKALSHFYLTELFDPKAQVKA